jgi:hypothetical protein
MTSSPKNISLDKHTRGSLARSRPIAIAGVACLLAVLGAAPLSAQFGMRGGVNLSRFVGGDAVSDSDPGLNLGASIPLLRLGPISLVPEVYYAKKGGVMEASALTGGASGMFDFDLTYIEVPVLLKLTVPVGPLNAYVGGGPTYGWNLKCHFTPESDPNATAKECGEQFSTFDTAMKSADKGIVLNAGLNLPVLFGLAGLNLDGRLVRGLDRITETSNGSEVKNQAITLMLGYYIGR